MLMGQTVEQYLIGVVVGHLYIVLKDILPVSHRINILQTPKFLYIFNFSE